jgi:antitoxin MazE6
VKIAISVPDHVFRRAEQAARRMRVPRSQFYSRAVEAYLKETAREDITERLNAVYSEELSEPDPFLAEAARRTVRRNK